MELKKVIRFNYVALSNEAHKCYNELINLTILKHNPVNLKNVNTGILKSNFLNIYLEL